MKHLNLNLIIFILALASLAANAGQFPFGFFRPSTDSLLTVVAGRLGGYGSAEGQGPDARFSDLRNMAHDSSGNVYVADSSLGVVFKVTSTGAVSIFAGPLEGGYGVVDGIGNAVRFASPSGVAVDSSGNVYVADGGGNTIRKITPGGVVSTVAGSPFAMGSADGNGAAARFYSPYGLVVDSAGNLFVCDVFNYVIRKITPAGDVSTFAGTHGVQGTSNGLGPSASFRYPHSLAIDGADNLYLTDYLDNTVRKITPSGLVTTWAGTSGISGGTDATGTAAQFEFPGGIASDSAGNLYVSSADTIRKISTTADVTTVVGTYGAWGSEDGMSTSARLNHPGGVAVTSSGTLYIADYGNNEIRKMTSLGAVTTFAGLVGHADDTDGLGPAARFYLPQSLLSDGSGTLYVSDYGNSTIRKINPTRSVTTFAGSAGIFGTADGTGSGANFTYPTGLSRDSLGNIFVADLYAHTIRKISPGGVVTTIAGTAGNAGYADGAGGAAQFSYPIGIAVDSSDNLFVADQNNYCIRKITPAGVVSTVAGQAGSNGNVNGTGSAARFGSVIAVAFNSVGDLIIVDSSYGTIRKMTPGGVVTTIAGSGSSGHSDGTGTAASFATPFGIAIDLATDNMYIADYNNNAVRKITPAGVVTTVIGVWYSKGAREGRLPASLNSPTGVAVDSGFLYVTTENSVMRVKLP